MSKRPTPSRIACSSVRNSRNEAGTLAARNSRKNEMNMIFLWSDRQRLQTLNQFGRVNGAVPIGDDDMRCRTNAYDHSIVEDHLIAVSRVDLDPDIVSRMPARANPHGHRQAGR